jgi:hypothetical protein
VNLLARYARRRGSSASLAINLYVLGSIHRRTRRVNQRHVLHLHQFAYRLMEDMRSYLIKDRIVLDRPHISLAIPVTRILIVLDSPRTSLAIPVIRISIVLDRPRTCQAIPATRTEVRPARPPQGQRCSHFGASKTCTTPLQRLAH